MITIEIDGKSYKTEKGTLLMQVADANGIPIPRFCYHKKLSVAASCRMCLVEVERAPKLMPACATVVMDGMKVQTRSTKVLSAQKAVMEFLLVNHPLDCPICDQGGECELQDVSMNYGNAVSYYGEEKRVIIDKNIGPLIATEMTRCIHCTRCVRFGEEVAGVRELGATGRGEHMKIGTFIQKTVDSELSGNVVDLCPVGALTAKPSRFVARAWEMIQRDGIAPHDGIGSNIHYHIRRNKIIRVAPKENESINEVWLSDKDRFSYQGLYAEDRLTVPMIKKEGHWHKVDWETALAFAVDGLKAIVQKDKSAIGALASPTSTIEELYLLQKVMRGIGSNNIDHRLHRVDFSNQDNDPLFPWLGQTLDDLEKREVTLIIGSHLRKEQPLINHRLRKATMRGGKCMLINPVDYAFNLPVAEKIIVPPQKLIQVLAGIVKALIGNDFSQIPSTIADSLKTISISDEQRAIAEHLKSSDNSTILLGNLVTAHPEFSSIRALSAAIAELSQSTVGYLAEYGNSAGADLAGAVPHRDAGGNAISPSGLNAYEMLTQSLKGYILLGIEPEDSCNSAALIESLKKADFVVSLNAYFTQDMEEYVDVILPIALFAETSGTYVNGQGIWQSVEAAVSPLEEIKPAWKVLRVFGNLFDLSGFDYTSSIEIRDELKAQIGDKMPDNRCDWQNLKIDLPPLNSKGSVAQLQRITELSIYASDSVVRRASALQATADAKTANGIHINGNVASEYQLNQGDKVTVKQGEYQADLVVKIDERVPDACVLIYSGQSDVANLGAWHGNVEIIKN